MADTYYIGTGGDYADWGAAYQARIVGGLVGASEIWEQVSDCTVTTWPNGGPRDWGGGDITFRCPFENSHKGNPNAGYKTYLSGANGSMSSRNNNAVGGHVCNYENLNVIQLTDDNIDLVGLRQEFTSKRQTCNVINCIIKGWKNEGIATRRGIAVFLCNQVDGIIKNCKVISCGTGIDTFMNINAGTPMGLQRLVENCVITDCFNGIHTETFGGSYPRDRITFRNVVAFDCNHTVFENVVGTHIYDFYKLTTDDGNEPVIVHESTGFKGDIVPADEFESIDYADDDWLMFPVGSISANSDAIPTKGVAPLAVKFTSVYERSAALGGYLATNGDATESATEDIAGLSRPGSDGAYSIGAHEFGYRWPNGKVIT